MPVVELIKWVGPDGTTIPFDGTAGYLMPAGGADGHFAPTFKHVPEDISNDGGTRLRNLVLQPRTITIPLEIHHPDPVAARALWRTLGAAVDPRKGDGQLQFTPPDGIAREYRCRYVQGLEGDDSPEKSDPGRTTWLTSLQVVAYDPIAQDVADTPQVWSIEDGDSSFWPVFPIRLGSSTVFADTIIDVFGDDLAWPVWDIAGPGSQLVLENKGKKLQWGGTLGPGETLTIDTRPPNMRDDTSIPRVRDNRGINRFAELTAWDIWAFNPGEEHVHIEFSGADTDSQVSCAYRQRWLMT